MRYFKLIALSCSAKGNKVLHKGDNEVYLESTFHNADELVHRGFLVEVNQDGSALGSKAKAAPQDAPGESALAAAVAEAVGGCDATVNPVEGKNKGDFTKNELLALCAEHGVEHSDTDTKQELLDAINAKFA